MSLTDSGPSKRSDVCLPRQNSWVIFLTLSLIVFLAHFYFFAQFGLYEDDLIFILPSLGWNSAAWLYSTHYLIGHFIQGRPLYFLFQYAFAFLGWRIGGLELIHLISFLLVGLTAILGFALFRRLVSVQAAFVGALVLVLFPIDTSRQLAMHQAALLLPMGILIWAFWCYLDRRYWLAYLTAAALLFFYESYYLPFLVGPLLCESSRPSTTRRLLAHTGIWLATLGGVFAFRNLLHDPRAGEVLGSIPTVLSRALTAPFLGFGNGLALLFLRPLDALLHATLLERLIMLVVLGLVLRTIWTSPAAAILRVPGRQLRTLILAGLIAWAIPYTLAFRADYYPPNVTIGRLSGVHAPAALGAGLSAAVAWAYLSSRLPAFWRRPAQILVSVAIAGMAGFGFHIQYAEYVDQWAKQRMFWEQVLDQIRDLQREDVVLFELSNKPEVSPVTKGFREGALIDEAYLLPYLIKQHGGIYHTPRLYGYWPGLPYHDTTQGRVLHAPEWEKSVWPEVRNGKLIYFRLEGARLERIGGLVDICGKEFAARSAPSPSLPPLKTTAAYRKIFFPPSSDCWFTLQNAHSNPVR